MLKAVISLEYNNNHHTERCCVEISLGSWNLSNEIHYNLFIVHFRYMLSTQLQSTDARKAFPCLDEPSLRAHFKLSIMRQGNMTTLANMPQETEPIDHGYVVV